MVAFAKRTSAYVSLPAPGIVYPVIVLAFVLRMIRLAELGLWGDEAYGLYLNWLGLLDVTAEIARDVHPPIYHYISYLWASVAGSGEFALRFISVCAGTLTVASTYAVGRRLAGVRVGILGAILMACAPFAVHYSQEARPHILALLWSALALDLLLRAVRSPRVSKWAAYALVSFLAGFTLYSTALWFATHGLLLLAKPHWRRFFAVWFGIEGCILVLAGLPWLLYAGSGFETAIEVQGGLVSSGPLALPALLEQTVSGLLAGVTLSNRTAGILSAVLLVASGAGILLIWRQHRRRHSAVIILAALAFLPVLGLYPIQLYYSMFRLRALSFLALPLYLLLAVGIDGWRSQGARWLVAGGAIMVVVWGLALGDYYGHFDRYSPEIEDYRPLIAQVEQHAALGDVVLYNARWHVGYFEAYYRGPRLDFRALETTELGPVLDRPQQVWVMVRDIVRRPGGATPVDQAEDLVSASAFKVGEAWFGRIRLAHYAVPPHNTTRFHSVGARFAHGVMLEGFTIQPELENGVLILNPGQAVYVGLIWHSSKPIDQVYNIFSHIIGPFNPATANPVWAQHDGVPANQERPTTSWAVGERIADGHVMWLDSRALPGDYLLEVGMYDPGTGERLQVVQPDGTKSDHVILAHIHVVAPKQVNLD